jgi:hypothetical protein
MHPTIMWYLANQRLEELRRDARRPVRPSRPERRTLDEEAVQLRLCRVGDDPQLHQLAQLEGRPLPEGRLVVAEANGRIVAALPLAGGRPLADPFARTQHLLPLLELRAAQVRGAKRRRLHPVLGLLPHRA